jgi:UDP-glucose 4-epimerase
MKALVVGGNGFIGSHLVDELIRRDWDVVVLDPQKRRYDPVPEKVQFIQGDLTQSFLVREALAGVDVVFHLAWTTVHEIANQDPTADIKDNLIPSIHLFELCRQMGVGRTIFMSSGGTVYGAARELPIPETHSKDPLNAYGITKLTVEKYMQMFHHLYELDYAILRPSVPYGPRQSPLGRQGAVAVFLYRVAQGLPITIWGDGGVMRDYFYISDLVSALLAAAEQSLGKDRIFNIGGSEEISLNQLLHAVEETVDRKANVEYLSSRKFDAARIILDTTQAYNVLGWKPALSLNDGLALTWSWISSTFEING